jgi:hypothetical protein
VSSLEDYAIEIVQEIEKINNAMGQRVWPVLTNQRKVKPNKNQKKVMKMHITT